MSLLNLTSDGLPNILVVLYGTVARTRALMTREELLERVAPANLAHEGGRMAAQTLNRWTELGLFCIKAQNVTLASAPTSDFGDDAELIAVVRKAACQRALAAENNVDLWAQEGASAADLTRSLAWLLAQDVYQTEFKNLEQLELEQMGDSSRRLMQNTTRVTGLQYWSHFLGFVRQPGGGVIDPTVAVRDVLSQCLQPGEGMLANAFIARLAELLPVLDGGRFRRAVEAEIRSETLPVLAPEQLSSSLSRTLLYLMHGQDIVLERRADTGSSIVLTGRGGLRADHRYHWVRRPDAKGLQ